MFECAAFGNNTITMMHTLLNNISAFIFPLLVFHIKKKKLEPEGLNYRLCLLLKENIF